MVFDVIASFLVGWIGVLSYFGIFLLMFLESSFFPFPSEIVIIPAGYLAFLGEMNLWLVVVSGIIGSLCGSWLNYFLADKFGRRVLLKFLKSYHLERVEKFFDKHGHISTFNGRLIPIVRQYISFPAGLTKMNPWKFSFYTVLGSGVWISILAFLGYFLGANENLLAEYLKELTAVVLVLVCLITLIYFFWRKK
jgi:membrane protein DedA with SNARE-associated domain